MNTLEELEQKIIIGERAMKERNRLLAELNAAGESQTGLMSRVNVVRDSCGAPRLTLNAVHAAIRRYKERTGAEPHAGGSPRRLSREDATTAPRLDEWEWVRAAENRQRVSLTTGECVTLLSWGTSQGRNRARVQFANGRQKTVSKNSVADLAD